MSYIESFLSDDNKGVIVCPECGKAFLSYNQNPPWHAWAKHVLESTDHKQNRAFAQRIHDKWLKNKRIVDTMRDIKKGTDEDTRGNPS